MPGPVLAIDFGTSNSAVAVLEGGRPRPIPLEAQSPTLPTAVFFPARGGAMRIGEAAAEALIAGEEGRYMRALKSVLGTPLLHEPRLIGGKRRSVAEIITDFLREIKTRAEDVSGMRFHRVLSGRPVHFHSAAPERDARAEADLRACYLAAGFEEVAFRYEPEAAAFACLSAVPGESLALIVDIGGGTSDFSVCRSREGVVEILASHGVRLGGTDFDHAVSMRHAMPLLGLGGQLRRSFGEGLLPVPQGIYVDLSSWAMIPFLYSHETERLVEDLVRHAVEPEKLRRLAQVIEDQSGHDLAFAVERGKIAANGDDPGAAIAMAMIERGLSARITRGSLNAALAEHRSQLSEAIFATLMAAGTPPAAIERVILVGGSSLLGLVEGAAAEICPTAALHRADVFTAVVDGLALASA